MKTRYRYVPPGNDAELSRLDREFIALLLFGSVSLSDAYGATYCAHNAQTHAGLASDRVNRMSPYILDLLRRAASSMAKGDRGLAMRVLMLNAVRNQSDLAGEPDIPDDLLERLAVRWLSGALQGNTHRQLSAAQFLTRLFMQPT